MYRRAVRVSRHGIVMYCSEIAVYCCRMHMYRSAASASPAEIDAPSREIAEYPEKLKDFQFGARTRNWSIRFQPHATPFL